MKAIILAAGEGKRMRPHTKNKPKCLIKVNGRSFLDRAIENFRSVGVNDISVITGYKAEKIERAGIKKYYNKRFRNTNMVYSLFAAEKEINDDIIICYGDIIFKKEILSALKKSSAAIAVVVDNNWHGQWKKRMSNPLDDAETMRVDKRGYIIELGMKPKNIKEIQGQYIGLIKISGTVANKIKGFYKKLIKKKIIFNNRNYLKMHMTDFLQLIINELMPVKAVWIHGGWFEFDKPRDLRVFKKI